MKEEKQYYVYLLASKRNGTLYIGVTSNLADRVDKHKQRIYDGFTKKYKADKLVYYETYGDVYAAISREKQLKNWKRDWKIKLIEKDNKVWRDLSLDLWFVQNTPGSRVKPGMTNEIDCGSETTMTKSEVTSPRVCSPRRQC